MKSIGGSVELRVDFRVDSWGASCRGGRLGDGRLGVLSIAKMRPGAERYYLDTVARGLEEYYSGAGETPGMWIGWSCAELGLSGEVREEDLSAVLAGRSPDGTLLYANPQPDDRRVAGFDLTFSAPKSVSVLYGLGSELDASWVRYSHHCAVVDALRYLELHACVARRGKDGLREIGTSGLVACGYTHRTSRAGDPQLHTHVLVANLVHADDGRWSALFANRAYQHAKTAGYVYQASLRAELSRHLGLEFGPVTKGTAEVRGVSKELTTEFSSRRHEILARLDEIGAGASRRTREIATLETRAPKDHASAADEPGLRDRWLRQCIEAGLDPPALAAIARAPREPEVTAERYDRLRSELLGPKGLTASVSTFERRDVVRAVAERLPDGAPLGRLDEVADSLLADPEAIALGRTGRGGEQLHTTRELLEVERRLVERALSARGGGAVVPAETVEDVLSERPSIAPEQATMVRRLTTSGDGVQVVVGKAGAGKTYALDATRAAFERSGYTVVGTALAARAAAELEAGSGIASCTIRRFLEFENVSELGRTSVVVVDEAGMVGTRDLALLVFEARRRDATVILVGDDRQLPEIEAGGGFGALAGRLGAVRLEENRRQREPWERSALDELRHGEVAEAVVAYRERGRLHLCDSAPAARAEMVDAWARARENEASVRMYALGRADVTELNELAREELRRRGQLGDDLVRVAGRGYAASDEVLFCRNDGRLGVLNGTRGVVSGLDESGRLVVETDRGERHVESSYLEAGHLAHGYASTVHKAQGATVEQAFVLGSEQLYREAGYVAMSRARGSTELFVVSPAFDEGLAPDGLTRALSASRAKELALESLATRLGEQALAGASGRASSADQQGGPPPRDEASERAAVRISDQLVGEAARHAGIGEDAGRGAPPLRRSALARAIGALHERLGRGPRDPSGGPPDPRRDDPFAWIERALEERAREQGRGRGLSL